MIHTQRRCMVFVVLFLALRMLAPGHVTAQKKLNVVTTIPDLKSIAESIGGDRVDVTSIAAGYQNPHFVDPKPSYILKMTRADVFITVGLDLELGWVPPLLNSARNSKILKGGSGYVDASVNVSLLEVPSDIGRERGDIHVFGNPHYWLDPANGAIIAQNIFEALLRQQPESQDYFFENLTRFRNELASHIEEWEQKMAPFRGRKIIAYHNQWPYLEQAFDIEIIDFLEPKPGIPPTASQLAKIIRIMKGSSLTEIIIAPYYKSDSAELVARNVDGQVVHLASSVEAFEGLDSYFDLFEYNSDLLIEAFLSSPEQP